jgi:hypothetical protein
MDQIRSFALIPIYHPSRNKKNRFLKERAAAAANSSKADPSSTSNPSNSVPNSVPMPSQYHSSEYRYDPHRSCDSPHDSPMSDEADSDFDDVTNEERSLADNSDKDDDEEQQDEIKVD